MQNPIFMVGQVYSTASIFREAVRAHSIKNQRAVRFDKNKNKNKNKNKIRVVCKDAQCPWMVYASWLNDDCKTFKVKTVGPDHTCVMVVKN